MIDSSASSSAALPSSPDRIGGPRDLASLHRDVWAIVRAHPVLFVLLPTVLWLPFDVLGELAALRTDDVMQQMSTTSRIGNFGSLIVGTLLAAVTASALQRIGRGEQVTLGAAMRDGAQHWGRVLRTWFVVGVLALFAMLLFVLPGLYLLVCWSLVVPVLVFENLGVTESMKRSRELVNARGFFAVLGTIVAIYTVYIVITVVPAIVVAGVLEQHAPLALNIAVNLVLTAVMNVVLSALTIGATLIYVDASGTRALSPVGADLVRPDGSRIPAPRSGGPAFVAASVLAGALFVGGIVWVAMEVEADEAAAELVLPD